MIKFKVGDKVKRVEGSFLNTVVGGTYEVAGVGYGGIQLLGHTNEAGQPTTFDEDNFELLNGESTGIISVLTPLEAAEALLKGEDLEVITSKAGDWKPLDKHQNSITIKNIKFWKFRHKPKIVLINGVEVAAPVELPVGTKVWYPSVACKGLQKGSAGECLSIYWLKEEDAQKALDAILLPFK